VFIPLAIAAAAGIWIWWQQQMSSTVSGNTPNPMPNPTGGGNLGYADIFPLAINAGFSGQDADTATAIALAESSGNPNAYNPETAAHTPQGLGSYGLWQVYLKAHPEFTGVNLYDPQLNANAAYSVYCAAGGAFTPWSTYNSGAWKTNTAAALQIGIA